MGKLRIFKLLDRHVIEASKHDSPGGEDRKIDFAVWHGVKNPYFITEKGGKRVFYRYIKGSSTILQAEQEKNGEIFNPQTDVVGFDSGNDIIIDEDHDMGMIKFLVNHPGNPESKYHVPGLHKVIFEEFVQEKYVKGLIKSVDTEDEALNTLRAIRNDSNRLKNVGALFNQNVTLSPDELYVEIRKIALANPQNFLDTIANRENEYLANVLKAVQLGVVIQTEKGFLLGEEGGLIMEAAASKGRNKNEKELAQFLATEIGDEFYKQIIIKTRQKEIELEQAV